MNVEGLRKDTKKGGSLIQEVARRTMQAYSNAGGMRPLCVLSPSQLSEYEEV